MALPANDQEPRARITVRIAPRASRDVIGATLGGEVVIRVTAPPVDGKANEAVERLLAKRLGVGRRSVAIVTGHHSRRKVVEIRGLSEAEVRARL